MTGGLPFKIHLINEASIRSVQRLGLRYEGFFAAYLKIRGRWRDHERWAITVGDWSSQSPAKER